LAPAALALIEGVRTSRTGLEIEACASGGGRIDMSALSWCNRVWLSDAHDPDIRTPMMAAYSLFAPAELMGCHIGPETSHQTGRRWSIHARASMAVLGSMGMELDPLTLSIEDARVVTDYVNLHRRHRAWLRNGHMLEVAHPDPGVIVLGVFSAQRNAALLYVLQTLPRSQSVPAHLQIPHLQGLQHVKAPLQDPSISRAAAIQPAWLSSEGIRADAAYLAGHGLPMPILAPMRGVLIELLPVAD
jgi:alpha-galactosidase